jgi:hypothetical protein
MEIIGNGVQFTFLKIYSIFFSVYTFLIYGITQKLGGDSIIDTVMDFYAGLILSIILIFIQIFVIKDSVYEDETILETTLTEARIEDSYQKRYEKFQDNIANEDVDNEIK